MNHGSFALAETDAEKQQIVLSQYRSVSASNSSVNEVVLDSAIWITKSMDFHG